MATPMDFMRSFQSLPFNEKSPIFILVSLYVHQTSTCGIGLCSAEDRKLSPTLESSILILCVAMIAAKYDWWPQKLIQINKMKFLVMLIYNSWVALVITNLAENLFLSPLFNFIGLIADAFSFGVSFISGEDSQVSELSDKLGCMILLLLSLAFLYYTLTNDGGIGLFISDLKKYIKKWREAREFKAMALGCISESRYDESVQYEPRRSCQTPKQRRRRKNTDKQISPRRCQSSCKFSD